MVEARLYLSETMGILQECWQISGINIHIYGTPMPRVFTETIAPTFREISSHGKGCRSPVLGAASSRSSRSGQGDAYHRGTKHQITRELPAKERSRLH